MKNKLLFFFTLVFTSAICYLPFSVFSQGTWTQKSDFGGVGRSHGVGFSIGTKGYIGMGVDATAFPGSAKKDFWEWDQASNAWTQKPDFPSTARRKAIGFSIGTKGYIGCGQDASGYKKDFYEFDPTTNTWTTKTNFGGTARAGAVSFVIGSKGYVGTGYDQNGYFPDFWEYNPSSNSWTQKANLIGGASANRGNSFGFASATKGYLGAGDNGSTGKLDLYEYDPGTDTWVQKANSFTADRTEAAAFCINGIGYAGTGAIATNYYQDLRTYIPSTNTWTANTSLTGSKRKGAVAFSIGAKGYIGTGITSSFLALKDFWEFDPGSTGVDEYENLVDVSVFPNPMVESATVKIQNDKYRFSKFNFKIMDISGKEVAFISSANSSFQITREYLQSGIYFYELTSENKFLATGKFLIR